MPISSVPRLWCYIVFSLDPVATLASLEDREAIRAAKKMPNKKYLAYARRAVNFPDDEAVYESFEIRLAKRGLPSQVKGEFIEPDMCVPILPAKLHPLGREPLAPSKPLPWLDCYHSSIGSDITVRVPKRYEDFSSAAELPRDEVGRHNKIIHEDNSRRAALHKAYNDLHPKPPVAPPIPIEEDTRSVYYAGSDNDSHDDLDELAADPSPLTPSEVPRANANSALAQGDVGCNAPPSDPENDPENDINNVVAAIIEMTRPPDTMIVAKVSYDLWSVKNIGDPDDFFKEKAYLEQLEKESKLRAIERARMIDEKAFSKKEKLLFTKRLLGRVVQQFNETLGCFTSSARSIVRRVGKGGNST